MEKGLHRRLGDAPESAAYTRITTDARRLYAAAARSSHLALGQRSGPAGRDFAASRTRSIRRRRGSSDRGSRLKRGPFVATALGPLGSSLAASFWKVATMGWAALTEITRTGSIGAVGLQALRAADPGCSVVPCVNTGRATSAATCQNFTVYLCRGAHMCDTDRHGVQPAVRRCTRSNTSAS